MKKKLIELAHKKGFSSRISSDNPWEYSTKERLRYYLWMQELRLWIRNQCNFHLTCFYDSDFANEVNIFDHWLFSIESDLFSSSIYSDEVFDSEELALESGLIEYLKCIK